MQGLDEGSLNFEKPRPSSLRETKPIPFLYPERTCKAVDRFQIGQPSNFPGFKGRRKVRKTLGPDLDGASRGPGTTSVCGVLSAHGKTSEFSGQEHTVGRSSDRGATCCDRGGWWSPSAVIESRRTGVEICLGCGGDTRGGIRRVSNLAGSKPEFEPSCSRGGLWVEDILARQCL